MYPGVIVDFDDQSLIDTIEVEQSTVRNVPLFGAVFTSDKGTEEWTRISGKNFFDMYGKNISFSRHGQPLLQAAMSINAGAELFCKRIVAADAKLAAIGIIAKVGSSTTETQKVDENGNKLYYTDDTNTETTTEVTAYPAMDVTTTTTITYSAKKVEAGVTTATTAAEAIQANLGANEYLLYTIADIGRGVSKKRIKIVPNYRLSKNYTYPIYTLSVLEDGAEVESLSFTTNPNIVTNGENISLASMIKTYSTQLTCIADDTAMDDFVLAVATATGIPESEIYSYDLLFGCTYKGVAMSGLEITADSIDLQANAGILLDGGDNGSFGNSPIKNPDLFAEQAVAALDGSFDTVIFNVDQYKINAWIDANYPKSVKRAIETLGAFREDFMYFRDQGLGQTSVELIEEACREETHNKFCATYAQSYDVIDPYTKRQISVTIGYDLAQLLVSHLDNGSILPTAGIKHNMVIKNAIYGTLSFSPTICPDPEGNQKEQLEELRVNFASYIDNALVIETLYTSQEKHTQWSYINNVMAIQDIVKDVRSRCPVIRYAFMDGEDLERYKMDVDDVIDPYRSNFKTLELQYVADTKYSVNKIFYAVLNACYRDFVQTEMFKVTAIADPTVVSASNS